MERAESGKILCARLLELDVVAHDADDVGLLLDGFLEVEVGHGWVRVKFYCGAEVQRREMAGPWWGLEKLWITWDRSGGERKRGRPTSIPSAHHSPVFNRH